MWNFAHRMDLYAEYANVVVRQATMPFQKPVHLITYSARRNGWKYPFLLSFINLK